MTAVNKVIVSSIVVVAAVIVAIAGWRWFNRAEPPPVGVIAFETAVPSLSSTDLTPETYCNPSIPGWYASGETEMSPTELVAWYSDRFGPVDDQVTAFINGAIKSLGPGYNSTSSTIVFGDLQVIYGTLENGDTWFAVRTYETVSHVCPPRDTEIWDPDQVTAWSYEGLCGQVIDFYGIEFGTLSYGRRASDRNEISVTGPPEGWRVLRYPNGRSVSWSLENPGRIYANPGDGNWYEYNRDNLCYLD
jgi:hypothetical protein